MPRGRSRRAAPTGVGLDPRVPVRQGTQVEVRLLLPEPAAGERGRGPLPPDVRGAEERQREVQRSAAPGLARATLPREGAHAGEGGRARDARVGAALLSPEHSARLGRVAAAEGGRIESLVSEGVLLFWTRGALERRLPPGDW